MQYDQPTPCLCCGHGPTVKTTLSNMVVWFCQTCNEAGMADYWQNPNLMTRAELMLMRAIASIGARLKGAI